MTLIQVRENRAAIKPAALRNSLFFMLGILLCFIRIRANLARGGDGGVAEKGSQLRGRQFQGANSLNNHAVFFLLTLFLQVPYLGLPFGGLLPGLVQRLVDFFSLVISSLLSENQFKRPKA